MKLFSEKALGLPAPPFELPGTDGKTHRLQDLAGEMGTVIAFICNHCPYVKAIIDRMVVDAKILQSEGFGFVAISANDPAVYPEDDLPHMKTFAAEHGFSFPYLFDESQEVAKAYGAVCTPDIYGLSAEGLILYRGRLDGGRGLQVPEPDVPRDLLEAMRLIAETGKGPEEQFPSMGCSIKWKE